jgi:hypothetical protein
MAIHKRLSVKKRTDFGTDLNDYDLSFLPTPAPGPFKCEENLVDIFDLEYFSPKLLAKTRNEFQKAVIKAIGLIDFKKIENGLFSYVFSAKDKSLELLLLKKSLLQFEFDWLNSFKDYILHHDIQHLRPDDLEKFESDIYNSIDQSLLISIESLNKYMKLATRITTKYLKQYAAYSKKKHNGNSLTNEYSEILVSKGFNNSKYYMPDNTAPDILSFYLKSQKEGDIFFERSLFSSYSICNRSAEHFMVAFNSRRRGIMRVDIAAIDYRIFSSFIVSPAFYDFQFEILVLPSVKPLYVYTDPENEIEQSFKIDLDPIL